MTTPKIAIIGAGPAGLTLARLLHVANPTGIDFKIYERDASPTSRPDQGGTLDLHADTGLAAIRQCGLWDSFRRYARYDGQEMKIVDKNATTLVHMGGGKEKKGVFNRPEIDRVRLQEILLESVPRGSVRWGRRLREVTEGGMLRFDVSEQEGRDGDGDEEGPFDLVVGADGAWSKVRERLTADTPNYSGISGFEMDIRQPEKTCPDVDRLVGRGAFMGSSDSKFLNAQRLGDGRLKVRSWYRCEEGEAKRELETNGKEGTLKNIISRYDGWAPEMIEFFKQGELDSLRYWTLYELPVGTRWEHKKGTTLMGDAASLATPFSGEGVNKAMTDSMELAALIVESHDPESDLSIDQAISKFEQKMFPRSENIQARTMNNKQAWFSPAAPVGSMTELLRKMTGESPSIFVRLLGTAPVVAAFYTYLWTRQQIGRLVRVYWRKM